MFVPISTVRYWSQDGSFRVWTYNARRLVVRHSMTVVVMVAIYLVLPLLLSGVSFE
jgi:hypothetical protein